MTKRSQRLGIWVIAVVMGVGSVGVFFVAILANQNNARDQQTYQAALAQYQAAVTKQTDELSAQYYPVLSQYAGEVKSFDAGSVTSLSSTDLRIGDGGTIGDSTSYGAYYIGFKPDGTVFDQSIANGKLKAPLPVQNNSGLIEGWTKGVVGMKLGGVRELTIPSDQAYGSTGSGETIPPNTPLKFIVLAIPTPAQVPVPSGLGTGVAS